jgi:hypothetical protein
MEDITLEEIKKLENKVRRENREFAIKTGINYHLKVPKKKSKLNTEICTK